MNKWGTTAGLFLMSWAQNYGPTKPRIRYFSKQEDRDQYVGCRRNMSSTDQISLQEHFHDMMVEKIISYRKTNGKSAKPHAINLNPSKRRGPSAIRPSANSSSTAASHLHLPASRVDSLSSSPREEASRPLKRSRQTMRSKTTPMSSR